MGLFDFIFGRKQQPQTEQPQQQRPVSFGSGPMQLGGSPAAPPQASGQQNEHELALQRYRYMLRTAPPETVEQAHAEAFARMTPEERSYVLQALTSELPERERATVNPANNDPQSLARVATRAEMRNPGTMERTLAARPGGMGGGMGMAGTLLTSFAAGFAGSMVASAFLNSMSDPTAGVEEPAPEEAVADEGFADEGLSDGGFGDESFGDFGGGFDEF
jgi:hypothetical protein